MPTPIREMSASESRPNLSPCPHRSVTSTWTSIRRRLPSAPGCRIDGTEPASIVERSVPGLGSRSRYVLRTYLSGGKIHREGIITFTTPTYFAQVSSYWPTFNESALLAFARQLQSRADQKLRH